MTLRQPQPTEKRPADGPRRPDAGRYFLSDHVLVALVDDLFELSHRLEALWAQLKQGGGPARVAVAGRRGSQRGASPRHAARPGSAGASAGSDAEHAVGYDVAVAEGVPGEPPR
jgi:hypothetical protein